MKAGIWVALGSALGGVLRYGVDQVLALSVAFPLSTFVANLSGSLLIGYFAGVWSGGRASVAKWHFWITGFCGGYTTFSTFSWQLVELVGEGEGQLAGIYAASSIGLGLVAVWVGLSVGAATRGDGKL